MLLCKTFDKHRQRAKDKPNHPKNMLVISRVSLGVAGAEQLYQVARMIKGNRERIVIDPCSNIQWVRSSGYCR